VDTLAAAAFSDDSQSFSLFERVGDAIDGMYYAVLRVKTSNKVFYIK
jgi:hypothetical protein